MNIDANTQEVTGFEFEHTDGQGRLWELQADFEYTVKGQLDDADYGLACLNDLRGRYNDGPLVEVAPDADMVKKLEYWINGNQEIYEAECEEASNPS